MYCSNHDDHMQYIELHPLTKRIKGKYNYLQKYYHVGAFFQDELKDVLERNYDEPTVDDAINKMALPKGNLSLVLVIISYAS